MHVCPPPLHIDKRKDERGENVHLTLLIESGVQGLLFVNGQFCGPMEAEGQAFPMGRNAEVYIQLYPFGEKAPLTAALVMRGGKIERLEPQENAFALCWPDGVIEVELRSSAQQAQEDGWTQRQEESGVLMRYLTLRLLGDMQAERLLHGRAHLLLSLVRTASARMFTA